LGFSIHTGWASLVAVAGSAKAPQVVDRRRIELLDGINAGNRRFVYHIASERSLAEAKKLVEHTTAAVAKATLNSLRAAIDDLKGQSLSVGRAAVLVGGGRPPETLDAILRSHAAIHAAEGRLYRWAIEDACRALKLKLIEIPARELASFAASAAGLQAAAMAAHVADMKRTVGAPWGADQKQAMLAAWAALGNDAGTSPRQTARTNNTT
jgi:hypothetical protein